MTVADLIRLLRRHDPTLRVLVADNVGIFGMHYDDVRLIETPHSPWGEMSLLVSSLESVRSKASRYQRHERQRPIQRVRARQASLQRVRGRIAKPLQPAREFHFRVAAVDRLPHAGIVAVRGTVEQGYVQTGQRLAVVRGGEMVWAAGVVLGLSAHKEVTIGIVDSKVARELKGGDELRGVVAP
jgi:hypothetical protein